MAVAQVVANVCRVVTPEMLVADCGRCWSLKSTEDEKEIWGIQMTRGLAT